MTSAEYRLFIGALDLTQEKAARLLGVNERTSRKWATGERKVPPTVSRFLRFLCAANIPAWRVIKLLD